MIAVRAILITAFCGLNAIANSADVSGSASAPTLEQEHIALAMVQRLRDCDIGAWETDEDSKRALVDIEASAKEPIPKADFDPRKYGLSPTAHYISALNEGASPGLLSWCRANVRLINFWLAPEHYVKSVAVEGSVLVLYQRIAERGLVAAVFHPVLGPDAKVTLQFSVADTTALFVRVSTNSNDWAPADAVDALSASEGAALTLPFTTNAEAEEPAWSENIYSDENLLGSPILPLLASLGDRWAMFAYAQELSDDVEIAMLTSAYNAGVYQAALLLSRADNDGGKHTLWLERAAKHGVPSAAGELAQALIENTDDVNGGKFSDCLRVTDAYAAAALVIARAPASTYRDQEISQTIERRAFAAARCKALGPERDALVRTTDQALRKSAVENDVLNLVQAAELCTRGEFNAAAILADKDARANIILGNCDYFLEQRPWVFRIIAECGND